MTSCTCLRITELYAFCTKLCWKKGSKPMENMSNMEQFKFSKFAEFALYINFKLHASFPQQFICYKTLSAHFRTCWYWGWTVTWYHCQWLYSSAWSAFSGTLGGVYQRKWKSDTRREKCCSATWKTSIIQWDCLVLHQCTWKNIGSKHRSRENRDNLNLDLFWLLWPSCRKHLKKKKPKTKTSSAEVMGLT